MFPKILIAPGYFKSGTTEKADPLLTAFLPTAEKLKAVVIVDSQNTNDEVDFASALDAVDN